MHPHEHAFFPRDIPIHQGNVLGVQNRTNNDSYNIFPDHPGNSSQAVTDGPAISDQVPSCPGLPIDWLCGTNQTTVDIACNNVNAYLDTDANNSADAGISFVTYLWPLSGVVNIYRKRESS